MSSLTVYKASAGSGKTFTLAVQYIKLLVQSQNGGEYARILAVTFTNKATAEMKDRILSQLYGIGHSLSSSEAYFCALKESLQAESGKLLPSDDELRRRCRFALNQILHDYSRFRVQTIDTFFQTVLRGLAHELGLTPGLQVEISDTEVLSKAVDRIVERLQDEPQVLEWLISLVRDRISNDQRWDVTREVKNFGRTIFNEDYLMRGDQLRERLSDNKFMQQYIKHLQDMEAEALAGVSSAGAQIAQAVYDSGYSYSDFSNGQTLRSFTEQLKAGNWNVEIGTRVRKWAEDPLSLLRKTNNDNYQAMLSVADEISGLLSIVIPQLEKIQYTVNSVHLALAHIKQLCLLDVIDREVADINAETSRFNLAKTPILLNRMIGDTDAPFVFEKIGAMLHHVMIDEFQDTSRLQWQNFMILLLESLSKGGHNLLVGDVKQSIYRWRGGDWRILGDIGHTMYLSPDIHNLDVNRRSSGTVVCFNNSFFVDAAKQLDAVSVPEIQIMKGSFSFGRAYGDIVQKVPVSPTAAEVPCLATLAHDGFVSVTLLDSKNFKKQEDWEPLILDDLKQQVRSLHQQGLAYSSMTILVRNNREMKPVIDSFALDDDMPPIVSDEAFLLSSSPAVSALIAALRVLDDPSDKVSAYYLRTRFSSISPDGIPQHLSHLPLYELMETLYRLLHLEEIANQDAYLFGFFDALLDFIHSETADIHSFLTYWDERLSRQAIPAGQVNGIRIITIHKAKGLEFHTVFMPFCTWAMERDRSTDLLWCSPSEEPYSQLGLIPITPSSKTAPNSVFARDYAESHLLSRLDELNALYVGFTRAVSNLYVWGVGNASNLAKGHRTVGDLIAAVMPEGTLLGEPVLVTSSKKDSDNRLMPDRQPLDISMCSFPASSSFHQSNRSQYFLGELTADDEWNSEHQRQQQMIEMGRLLHSILQQIHTLDDLSRVLDSLEHEGVITRYLSEGTYVNVRRADIEQWFSRGFGNPVISSWFSGEWELFNECSIVSVNSESHQIEHHRPDRVMVSQDASRIVVVDYKFGIPHHTYEDQVRTYMHLLADMYPSAHVEGYLWYVYSSRLDVVPATPPVHSSSSATSQQLTLDF